MYVERTPRLEESHFQWGIKITADGPIVKRISLFSGSSTPVVHLPVEKPLVPEIDHQNI